MTREKLLQYPSTHIGDGAYVSHIGYEIIVWTQREEGLHWISIEPPALKNLVDFLRKQMIEKNRGG